MDQTPPNSVRPLPNDSESEGNLRNSFGTFAKLPKDVEDFRTVPKGAESFGNKRKDSEGFGNVPNIAEQREKHTVTVREAAKVFETASVARTERSIINWCQPNRMGVARLDCYLDPNEGKYFVTPQSVEAVIQEEKAKLAKRQAITPPVARASDKVGVIAWKRGGR